MNLLAIVLACAVSDIPCAELNMPWIDIPSFPVRCIYLDQVYQPAVFYTPQDPITKIRIGTPRGDWDLTCGRSYSASLADGLATVQFVDGSSYYIELTHTSGVISHGSYEVMTIYGNDLSDGKPPKESPKKHRIPVDYDKAWVVSNDNVGDAVCHDPKITKKKVANTGSVAEFAQLVCELFDECGGAVDLNISAHGTSIGGVPQGGIVNLGGPNNTPMDSGNAKDYGEAIKGKVLSTSFLSCYAGHGTSGSTFLSEFAEGSEASCSGDTGVITYTQTRCWDWDEWGMVPCLKLYAGGDTVVGSPSAPIQVENMLVQSKEFGLRLPLGYGTSGTSPFADLGAELGSSDSLWDLNRDGIVDQVDMELLVDALEN